MLSSSGGRTSLHNHNIELKMPEMFSDSRMHGYQGPTRHVRVPRAASKGAGAIDTSEDKERCVIAGRESLRVLHVISPINAEGAGPADNKSVVGRGGHRIDTSRNYWDGSGLKVDSSSTDVAWCHGIFNQKILTSARNGELIMWDLNKSGPSKYERRVRDHARSIHVLAYSPVLQTYCMTGSADGDLRIWDLRDLSKSIMRIHHPAAVRAVAFSPLSSQSRHVVAALDNGSIHRWDLTMGQRGQLDRIPVAHAGPILSLDWVLPQSSTMVPPAMRPAGNWYGGSSAGFFDDIIPSGPIVGGASSPDGDGPGPGWIVSGGMDHCVKVWDLATPVTKANGARRPAYTLRTSFPVRRVLWRPGYECELAIASNADFGTGTEPTHSPPSASGLGAGHATASSSPRLPTSHISAAEGARNANDSGRSTPQVDTADPVEIWDVRRGYIAKWVIGGSAVEGGVTDIAFGDSHALWALHSSGSFSQLDIRNSRRPIDAIPRSAIAWNTSGSITFATDRPRRWEVPYDDINPEIKKDKATSKGLGDSPYRPSTQTVGTLVLDSITHDVAVIEKVARGYIYEGREKREICAHNAKIAYRAGAEDATQTWLLLESLLTDFVHEAPPTPPLSPLPLPNHHLPHSMSAPAAIPTVGTVSHPNPPTSHRAMTADAYVFPKDKSPGSKSRRSDERGNPSPRKVTPASSNPSSPRRSTSALPTLPATIFARRESNSGLPPPPRSRLSSFARRKSFSAQSILGSESQSESLRSSVSRHVGEGALSDSDSDSGEDDGEEDDDDAESDGGSKSASDKEEPAIPRAPISPYLYPRNTTAHPSPLSRVAGQQTWTEDEKEDEDSPSPASTSASESEGSSRRPAKMKRRSSTRSKTRSRSSTVASLAAGMVFPSPQRKVVKQDSQSSIRTVTADHTAPPSTAGLGREDTVRNFSTVRPASAKSSPYPYHYRARSEALSTELVLDPERYPDDGAPTPHSVGHVWDDGRKAVMRDAEERYRRLAWESMKLRFEVYADEGDVTMCAMLSMVVPDELGLSKGRITRFVEAYIEILTRLRLHTCAAYLRKHVSVEEIGSVTSLQTTIYTSCTKCRKSIQAPAAPMVHAGKPSGSYAYCISCRESISKCAICHLPVRALIFQCPVCLHGGHQACYQDYFMRRPPEEVAPPALPPAMHAGRSAEAHPPRGRALSRSNSVAAGDTESDDGASTHGEGDGFVESYNSGRMVAPPPSHLPLGHLCVAGCGHTCWGIDPKLFSP